VSRTLIARARYERGLNEGWITRVGPLPRPVEGLRPPICSDQKLASAVLMYLDSLQPGDRPMLSVYERFRNEQAPRLPSRSAFEARGGTRWVQRTRDELEA